MKSLGIVLVNWNGFIDTADCIASILAADRPRFDLTIVVVDNDSQDGSLAKLADWIESQHYQETETEAQSARISRGAGGDASSVRHYVSPHGKPDLYLVGNSVNAGFAGGNNLGIRLLLQRREFDYFWLLNNDTTLRADGLVALSRYIASHPGAGIFGTVLVHSGSSSIQALGGVRYNYWTGRGQHIGEGLSVEEPLPSEAEVCKELGYVSGASMCVSADFLEKVGFMEESYFLYNEEADWCWRARGFFDPGVALDVVVYHKEGASIGTGSFHRRSAPSLLADFLQARNKLRFALRHLPASVPTIWFFLLLTALKRMYKAHYKNGVVIIQALLGRSEPQRAWFRRIES